MKHTTDTGEAAMMADPDSAALITNSDGEHQKEWLDMLHRMAANNDYWRARATEYQQKWITAEMSLANWKFAYWLSATLFLLVATGLVIALIQ